MIADDVVFIFEELITGWLDLFDILSVQVVLFTICVGECRTFAVYDKSGGPSSAGFVERFA